MEPPIALQKKARTDSHDGWAMVDAGEFAVHIISAEARERYFGDRSPW
jgi:ribosomal silencing factor RsfS